MRHSPFAARGLIALVAAAGLLALATQPAAATPTPTVSIVQSQDSIASPMATVMLQERTDVLELRACAVFALQSMESARLATARPATAVTVDAGDALADFIVLTVPFLVGMTALAADRDTHRKDASPFSYLVGAAKKIYRGSLVVIANTGYAQGGTAAATHTTVGRACDTVDNSAGAAGDLRVNVERGVFKFTNSAAADLIGITEVGKDCYVVDDQTVAKTDGGGARSVAGKVRGVDADGVWVEI